MLWQFIDANGRVGNCTSPSVGSVGAENEDENGCRLRTTLEAQQMWAVNTFMGGHRTWSGSKGHKSRIDYICSNMERDKDPFSKACIEEYIDLAPAERDDH
eukprot:6327863-Karenia_brevis.AAC.1